MIKLLLSSILFCLVINPLFSQENSSWEDYPNMGIMHYSVIPDDIYEEQFNYQNYLFETSKLITKENTELNSIKIRYNVKTDVMECIIGSQYSIIKSPEKLKEININGECYEYTKYIVKKDTTNGYLQKLYSGGQKIYVKHFISTTENKLKAPKLKSYYLVQNKGELPRKFNSVRSLISNSFKNLIKKANEFEKLNQLNLDKPQDLKKLLTYLRSLSKDIVALR